jgi:hypothetical protein
VVFIGWYHSPFFQRSHSFSRIKPSFFHFTLKTMVSMTEDNFSVAMTVKTYSVDDVDLELNHID